jgi:hypothetical protein
MFHRLGLSVQQAFGVRQPTVRDGECSTAGVVRRKRQRDPGGGKGLACRSEAGVRALPKIEGFLELPRPPSGFGKALEVCGREGFPVGAGVRGVGISPGMTRRGGTRFVEDVDDL